MSFNFCLPCGNNCCKTDGSMTNGGAGRPQPGKKHSQSHSFTPVDIFKPILVDSPALMRLPARRASPEDSLNSVDTLKNSELIDPATISKSSYSISSLYAYDINDEEMLKPLLRSRTESEIYLGDEFTLTSYPSSPQCIWVPVPVAQEDLGKSLDFLDLKLKHIDSSRESSEISSIRNYRMGMGSHHRKTKNGHGPPIVVSSLEQTKIEPTYKTCFNIDIIPKNSAKANANANGSAKSAKTFPRYKGMQSREDYKCFINILKRKDSVKEHGQEQEPNELKHAEVKGSNSEANTNTLTAEPIQSPTGSDYFSNSPSPNSVLSHENRVNAENSDNTYSTDRFGDQVATLTQEFQNQLNESDSMPVSMLKDPDSVRAKLVINQKVKIIDQPTEVLHYVSDTDYGQIHDQENPMPLPPFNRRKRNSQDNGIEMVEMTPTTPPIAIPGPSQGRRLMSPEEIREIVNGTGRGRSQVQNGHSHHEPEITPMPKPMPIIQSKPPKRFHVQLVEEALKTGTEKPKLKRDFETDKLPEVLISKPLPLIPLQHHHPLEPFVELDYSLRRKEREHIYEVCKDPTDVPTPTPVVEKQIKLPVEIHELSSNVKRMEEYLQNNKSTNIDLTVLAQLIESEEFLQVLPLFNQIQDRLCLKPPPAPACVNLQQLVQECIPTLYNSTSNLLPESYELINLLNKPNFEQMIHSHDILAKRMELAMETPYNLGAPADDFTFNPTAESTMQPKGRYWPDHRLKNVQIEKTNEPLGVTILNEGDKIIVGRIITGGSVGSSGLLREGDEIIEINGVEMTGKSINEVCEALSYMSGTLTFRIAPASASNGNGNGKTKARERKDSPIPIRALFNYEPEGDLFIPCKELGIGFIKGDIMFVINTDDANWWQAYREGETDRLAGLIPSKSFRQQREILKRRTMLRAMEMAGPVPPTSSGSTSNQTREMSSSSNVLTYMKPGKKSGPDGKKNKKITRSSTTTNFNPDISPEDIPTYEEVILYYPCQSFRRPVILVGPPNIGRHELRQMLIRSNPKKYEAAIPHTTRSPLVGEVNGRDYHFISRSEFEAGIMDRSFIEYGEFENHYYGTKFDSLQAPIDAEKCAVLNLHPRSIMAIRTAGFKPFVIFISPPPLARFKEMRQKSGQSAKDDELKKIIRQAMDMEDKFGHLFESVIVITDLEKAFKDLQLKINYIEAVPHYVPKHWMGGRDRLNSMP